MYNMDIKRINISSHAHYNFGGNDMIDKINIEKDYIEFGNTKVHPPFTREKVDAVLGVPEIKEKDIEITYKAPRSKNSIYDLKKPDGPVLRFDSFEFKLLVIEELMYEKELLTPVFEIYDFAEKNPKREIDVDREGYEIIPEAKKWFRDYQIPAGLAPQISELIWDGGLNVFHQICPFWDGEDSCFDVKKLSTEEVQQFTGLKKVITGSGFSQKAIKMLIEQGIEVSE